MFIVSGVCLVIYILSQIYLVLKMMNDRWPLGDILFGTAFFAIGLLVTLGLSEEICEGTMHYIDGTFFAVCAVLLATMFVYKYWDSITKEDLEFSVGGKQNVWEVRDIVDEEEFAYGPTAPSQMGMPQHGYSNAGGYDQSMVYGSDVGGYSNSGAHYGYQQAPPSGHVQYGQQPHYQHPGY
jgi:hypothetical protein